MILIIFALVRDALINFIPTKSTFVENFELCVFKCRWLALRTKKSFLWDRTPGRSSTETYWKLGSVLCWTSTSDRFQVSQWIAFSCCWGERERSCMACVVEKGVFLCQFSRLLFPFFAVLSLRDAWKPKRCWIAVSNFRTNAWNERLRRWSGNL